MTYTIKEKMKTYNLNMTISAKEDINQDEILDNLVKFAETNDYLVGGGLQELDEDDNTDKNNMEKSRTPLEILLEDLKKTYGDHSSNPFFSAYSIIIMKVETLLETEKERIITDYNSGYNNGNLDTSLTGEEYYNKYYKK